MSSALTGLPHSRTQQLRLPAPDRKNIKAGNVQAWPEEAPTPPWNLWTADSSGGKDVSFLYGVAARKSAILQWMTPH